MKLSKVVILFLFLLPCFANAEQPCFEGLKEVGFVDLDGKKTCIPDNTGRLIFINMWATWCGPCRTEITHVNKIYDEFKAKEVDFFAVSLDTVNLKHIGRFADQMGIKYPVLVGNPTEVMRTLSIVGVPASIIIDKERKKTRTLIGLHTYEELRAIVAGFLEKDTLEETE